MQVVYIADDGTKFSNEKECLEHEKECGGLELGLFCGKWGVSLEDCEVIKVSSANGRLKLLRGIKNLFSWEEIFPLDLVEYLEETATSEWADPNEVEYIVWDYMTEKFILLSSEIIDWVQTYKN